MNKQTFVIATDQPDAYGDVIKLDGVRIPDKVLLTHDFNTHHPIGFVEKIFIENGLMKATTDIPESSIGLYPALGISVIKREGKVITECKLMCVGLCSSPNVDTIVKTIREQIANK